MAVNPYITGGTAHQGGNFTAGNTDDHLDFRHRRRIDNFCRLFSTQQRQNVFVVRLFFAFRQKSLFIPGCVQGATIYLVCVFVSLCATYVVFTYCESCTRPISTNPGPMEAGEYGLTRGTCCVARRLQLVAVARLLWISWCVFGGVDFVAFCFSFERSRPAASMSPPCLICLSTIIRRPAGAATYRG